MCLQQWFEECHDDVPSRTMEVLVAVATAVMVLERVAHDQGPGIHQVDGVRKGGKRRRNQKRL